MTPWPPRQRRVVPAVAVAAIVGGLLTTFVVDVVAVQTVGHAVIWPYRSLADHLRIDDWSDSWVIAVAAALVVVGILLLIAAFVPGRYLLLRVADDGTAPAAGVAPRDLRTALRRAATQVDGVGRAKVSADGRRARIDVFTPFGDTPELARSVQVAAASCLDALSLAQAPAIAVRVHPTKDH
jgi:Family of unknown function (DUF6286)